MGPTFAEPLTYLFAPPAAPWTLYLDRDGVLNDTVLRGREISSPRALGEFHISDDVDALAAPELSTRWNLVVVTNQPDLTRGTISLEFLEAIHRHLSERLPFCAVYICPHLASEACACRKPEPGLIERFRKAYPRAVKREWMVGDGMKDRLCARAAGVPFALRLHGYNGDMAAGAPHVISSLWKLADILDRAT